MCYVVWCRIIAIQILTWLILRSYRVTTIPCKHENNSLHEQLYYICATSELLAELMWLWSPSEDRYQIWDFTLTSCHLTVKLDKVDEWMSRSSGCNNHHLLVLTIVIGDRLLAKRFCIYSFLSNKLVILKKYVCKQSYRLYLTIHD